MGTALRLWGENQRFSGGGAPASQPGPLSRLAAPVTRTRVRSEPAGAPWKVPTGGHEPRRQKPLRSEEPKQAALQAPGAPRGKDRPGKQSGENAPLSLTQEPEGAGNPYWRPHRDAAFARVGGRSRSRRRGPHGPRAQGGRPARWFRTLRGAAVLPGRRGPPTGRASGGQGPDEDAALMPNLEAAEADSGAGTGQFVIPHSALEAEGRGAGSAGVVSPRPAPTEELQALGGSGLEGLGLGLGAQCALGWRRLQEPPPPLEKCRESTTPTGVNPGDSPETESYPSGRRAQWASELAVKPFLFLHFPAL